MVAIYSSSFSESEAGVKLGTLILSGRAGRVRRSAKVVGVARHQCPIAIENNGQQVPVFDAPAANPNDVRTLAMAAVTGHLGGLGRGAFQRAQVQTWQSTLVRAS